MIIHISITEWINISELFELLQKQIFSQFDISDEIVSDQNSLFISHYYLCLYYLMFIKH